MEKKSMNRNDVKIIDVVIEADRFIVETNQKFFYYFPFEEWPRLAKGTSDWRR
jgi:hypothetical protein